MNGVRKYISTNPKYKSKYYAGGYSDDEYGVCTDVVANGLLEAGYDMMELVNNHIVNNRDVYDIENIDKNIGKTVSISGFVFTMPDFKDNYFVCGRNMILSGNEKVVGFLCDYEKAYDLLEAEWIEVTGTIEKGFYQTDMPIIKIKTIKKITAPENTFVNPPSNY